MWIFDLAASVICWNTHRMYHFIVELLTLAEPLPNNCYFYKFHPVLIIQKYKYKSALTLMTSVKMWNIE